MKFTLSISPRTVTSSITKTKISRAVQLLLAFFAASQNSFAASNYFVRDIGLVDKFSAMSLNNNSEVVGNYYSKAGKNIMFVTDAAGENRRNLRRFGVGGYSYVGAINDNSRAAGYGFLAIPGFSHAFLSAPGGYHLKDLTSTRPECGFEVMGLNNSEILVGQMGGPKGGCANHAFATKAGGHGVFDLGALAGGSHSRATAINNGSGNVIGVSDHEGSSTSYDVHAFYIDKVGNAMRDLGTLGGKISYATGLNDSGQVVGYSYIIGDSVYHAFVTGSFGGDMFDVGVLNGIPWSSSATGINNLGRIVGGAQFVKYGPRHAFVTGDSATGIFDLNSLASLPTGVTLDMAVAINNRNNILATGSDGHAYLLCVNSLCN